jgi:LL-diaminopimelate aminotransferase
LNGKNLCDNFNEILESFQVVTIPGTGFGSGDEGFLRMSSFAPRDSCIEAIKRFREFYKK